MIKINKKIDLNKVPAHVAFIMDGNGRWANKRGLHRHFGHRIGYTRVLMAVKRCADIGIKVVSVYAFSTENWNRPKEEVDEIFRIIRENMHKDLDEFQMNGIKVVASGDITKFPKDLYEKLTEIIEKTKNNTRCTLNLCINYGGRDDIVYAANRLNGKKVTEAEFGKLLYNSDLPDLDLVVRTSGEQRVSNFMLWQMAYAEFLFIKPHWPGISEKLVDKCIVDFQKRKRRFGKV
ncbi:MAG: polyprenyl diphosphate synthase [Firmicutes bacterium]|nr:polyprenyl diphosphate synthase [Bacillota bacterium]